MPPASIADWLALVGDTADGVPGVAHWDAKSAATVLARYRRIEAIPDDVAQWDVNVRGAEDLEDLRWRGARKSELAQLCREIGDDELMAGVPLWRD